MKKKKLTEKQSSVEFIQNYYEHHDGSIFAHIYFTLISIFSCVDPFIWGFNFSICHFACGKKNFRNNPRPEENIRNYFQ